MLAISATSVACGNLVAGSSETSAAVAPLASGIGRATRYYDVGPSARHDFDMGNIGGVVRLVASLPAGSSQDVVVAISFDDRSSTDDRFVLDLSARRDDDFGPFEKVTPAQRSLSSSPVWTTTTASFLPSDVDAGSDYWFAPSVNVSDVAGHRAFIVTKRVALVVETTSTQ